jgi:asparagine synthase (glutamine-hydrolysing)
MCGIAGIIRPFDLSGSEQERSPLERSLHDMASALQHRGPEGQGVWINPGSNMGFSHRRLCIIDLSEAGHQPMHYMDRYTIVHNGEIYNYVELRQMLISKGYSFRSQTDTEVIVAAYDCWKSDCVEHFDGMFAFGIWDEDEKIFFGARDRFGEKPFFYSYDKKQLVFGSEMKALWAFGIPRNPNLKTLFNFLTIGYTDNPADSSETFFDGIRKLPAASILVYYAGTKELVVEKYWDIDPEEENDSITPERAIEEFNHLFQVSVSRRLRSDVPVGIGLSGGLDSSAITATSASLTNCKMNAFTASFPGYEKDELQYASVVAGKFGLIHHVTTITADMLANDWEKLCYHQEEPFGSASIYAQYCVFELARQNNIKVLLDGQGADEILAGYHKYYKWYWQELFHKRRLYRSHELRDARNNLVKERFGFKNIVAALFPDLASVLLERQYLLKAIRHDDLTKSFVQLQSREAYYTSPGFNRLNDALYFNTCTHGLEELLRFADRNAMAHGREPRLPFLSHELVEFVFSLPGKFKISNGWTKSLLRKSMQDKLPPEITWRKDKTGFEPPQKNWMQNRRVQDLIHQAKQKLVDEKILERKVLDKAADPKAAHEKDSFDWRYLSSAFLFK